MIANFDLSQLFLFPVKDNEARKNFLIATLVYFASFIIPIIPIIFAMGYTARIMRRVVNGEEPRMVAWDDWESMFKDGLYLFGVRLAYSLPLLIIVVPLYIGMMLTPVWMEMGNNTNDAMAFAPFLLFGLGMIVIFPISLALGIVLPAAENHVVITSEFAAGFRVREWWAIFRANWTGFLLAYLIAIVASSILSMLVGIAMITIVLFCVLPFIMPAIAAYLNFVMYAAFAQAYKEGKSRLAQQLIANSQEPTANS